MFYVPFIFKDFELAKTDIWFYLQGIVILLWIFSILRYNKNK